MRRLQHWESKDQLHFVLVFPSSCRCGLRLSRSDAYPRLSGYLGSRDLIGTSFHLSREHNCLLCCLQGSAPAGSVGLQEHFCLETCSISTPIDCASLSPSSFPTVFDTVPHLSYSLCHLLSSATTSVLYVPVGGAQLVATVFTGPLLTFLYNHRQHGRS